MFTTPRPSTLSRTLALVPPVVALVAQQANAGGLFLKVDVTSGPVITGESLDVKHSGWIEIMSMQAGIANPVTLSSSGGGITPGKSTRSDLVVTKLLDRASPQLFLGCAVGTRYPTVTLELTTSNSDGASLTYYKITLTNVIVSSLTTSAGGERPTEAVSLSYEKITTDYYMVDSKGSVPTSPTTTATWNFANNSTK
ncbi:MAG: type VI secretion system tube protein Hcp [Luteolibacter sp.]|uniref:Hcp family type VI secretion system effector n=1 Tax=Luteolibacter sp. TaxID=1962973 RepID=UPI0032662066